MKIPLRPWILATAFVATAGALACAGPVPTISRAVGQATPTRAEPLFFSVVFSEPVTGFDASDVILSIPATVTVSASPPHDGATYAVSVSAVATDGQVCLAIPAEAAVGLDGAPSESCAGADPCVTLDRQPPPPPELVEPADAAATSDLSPRFAWTAPADLSGVAKYEIEIRGPKPRDYVTTRTSYTPTLGIEGIYTWRVNALDRAENLGDWTSWRTLVLDATPPTAPGFGTASVAPGAWSRSEEVILDVTSASDAGSGVGGYCVAWTPASDSAPGGSANRGPDWNCEVHAFPLDGIWWGHAVAVDTAGNRSAPCHAGPFLIDRTPPTLGGWSGTLRLPNDPGCLWATADWSAVVADDALDPAPSLAFSVPAGARLPIGASDVLVTAADRAGNTVTERIEVLVDNTEPPVVRIDAPRPGARIPLGAAIAPTWASTSLAPVRTVRTEGLVGGALDARSPGRHVFVVTVTDATGLSAAAEVHYVVTYAAVRVDFLRVAPNGAEQTLSPSPAAQAGEGPVPRIGLAEWLRVRCAVDASLAGLPRAPVTFSLVRVDPARPGEPVLERVGVLRDDGMTYALDLPLVVFRPGRYTLWLGFVDATSVEFRFDLAG